MEEATTHLGRAEDWGVEQRGKRRGGERSGVLLLLGSAGDGERSGVLLLLGSADDGEVGLLKLRCGGAAIHFLPPSC
jgi:hypothetical protein